MAYKDKDKQREANKKAMQRLRAKNAGIALSGSGKVSQNAQGLPVVDEVRDTLPVIPSKLVIPCDTIWESEPGAASKIAEIVQGMTVMDERSMVGIDTTPKRGKDIKCFADLPRVVQLDINMMSDDEGEHKRRTATAINYQHQFPDRYHSTGVV